MKTQIYNFETRFNFGKHIGKSLLELIQKGYSPYIAYLIYHDVLCFILDPETMYTLDKKKFFDNLEMAVIESGGTLPMKDLGFSKEIIIEQLMKNYNDFVRDPNEYEKNVTQNRQRFIERKKYEEMKEEDEALKSQINFDEIKGPFHYGSSADPNENQWLGILPDDEAEEAYWNTL
jgi:hypothetical protein